MSVLDDLPVATLTSLALIIGALIALINGSIDFQEFAVSLGAGVGGLGVLGVARSQSGKGIRR
jgi:hypothetical protein